MTDEPERLKPELTATESPWGGPVCPAPLNPHLFAKRPRFALGPLCPLAQRHGLGLHAPEPVA